MSKISKLEIQVAKAAAKLAKMQAIESTKPSFANAFRVSSAMGAHNAAMKALADAREEAAKPTISQVITTIKALPGMSCTWSSQWQEFRVFYVGCPNDEGARTNDGLDAIGTARTMAENKKVWFDAGKEA